MSVKSTTIVVGLTTCNSQRFLAHQLNSLAAQKVKPDALVISDDGSTDMTLSILTSFSRTAPFPVEVIKNRNRAGLHVNSDIALQRAAQLGDVVALCDHDDIWDPEKIGAIQEAFSSNPSLTWWFSNANLIDEFGFDIGATVWDYVSLDSKYRIDLVSGAGLRRLLYGWSVTAVTCAIKSTVFQYSIPSPATTLGRTPLYSQDGWLVILAHLLGDVSVDERCLVKYRRHHGQMSHGGDLDCTPNDPLLRDLACCRLVGNRVRSNPDAPWNSERVQELLTLEDFFETRAAQIGSKHRLRRILSQLQQGNYERYAQGWRTAVYDFVGRPPIREAFARRHRYGVNTT